MTEAPEIVLALPLFEGGRVAATVPAIAPLPGDEPVGITLLA